MESLTCLGVLRSHCIGERRIDELRLTLGNTAETSDDGAETWFTFASQYDICKLHNI